MQMLIQNAKLRDREELVNILIDGGKIVEIGAGLTAEAETVIDAEGNLTTASYIDPHIHLDKVNVLDVLPKNQSGTLKEAIEMLWDKNATMSMRTFWRAAATWWSVRSKTAC